MPVYEYLCKGCDHEFEREQRISDKPVKKCPSCGAMKVKRLISQTSFVLKGGGWYGDLYSSTKPDKSADGKSEASGTAAESSSDKKDDSAAGKSDGSTPDSKSEGKGKGKKGSAKPDGGKAGGSKSDGGGKAKGSKAA